MDISSVFNFDHPNRESLDQYIKRWPSKYDHFPKCLVNNWVYRHWPEFSTYWYKTGVLDWKYELQEFDIHTLLKISHHGDWIQQLDCWGDHLFRNEHRKRTWLGSYMLEHGTTPAPILVLESDGELPHPRSHSGEKMCAPLQLIEGHMRTAYLRGMINNEYGKLQKRHLVWVAKL